MIKIDEDKFTEELREMAREEIKERLKELEEDIYFMNTKQFLKTVNMSWNSANEHFLSDPEFPVVRLGNKFLYPRKEVFAYLDKFYVAVRDSGGDIQRYKRR